MGVKDLVKNPEEKYVIPETAAKMSSSVIQPGELMLAKPKHFQGRSGGSVCAQLTNGSVLYCWRTHR